MFSIHVVIMPSGWINAAGLLVGTITVPDNLSPSSIEVIHAVASKVYGQIKVK